MFDFIAAMLLTPTLLSVQLPLLQLPFLQNNQPELKQRISLISKPAVVRIVAACQATYDYDVNNNGRTSDPEDWRGISIVTGDVGTGFFVDPDGFIVTSSRIVQPAIEESCKDSLFRNLVERIQGERNPANLPESSLQDIRTRSRFNDVKPRFVRGVVLPNGEIVDFEPPDKADVSTEEGGDGAAVIKINTTQAPTLPLADPSVETQLDDVTIIGYPIAADNTRFLNQFFEAYFSEGSARKLDSSLGEATPTNGRVANNRKTLPGNIIGLQLEPQLSSGNVGSPVLNSQGAVIGIVFYSDQSTFIPFALPFNLIDRAVRRSGATSNQENLTNLRYQEGLKRFWAGDYDGAKVQFEAAKSLFAQHPEAERMINESQLKSSENWTRRNYLVPLGIVGGILLGLLGAYIVFKKRRLAVVDAVPLADPSPVLPVSPPRTLPQTMMSAVNGAVQSHTEMSVMYPVLELRNKQGQVQRFYLSEDCHKLGRDPAWADLPVTAANWDVISKHHAVLRKEGESYRIFDGDQIHGSTNGTYLNGARITTSEGQLLRDQDQLLIGLDPRNQVVMTYSNPVISRSTSS